MKKIIIITSLSEIFSSIFSCGVVGNALKKELWNLRIINLYDFGIGNHKKIDDVIYGGGAGMLIMAEVISKAIEHVKTTEENKTDFIYMSPRGKKFNQQVAQDISKDLNTNLCIICGRFEGIDQRVIDYYKIEEISIGDFVLSNGELAAAIIIDSIVRLIPNVMGNQVSSADESFNYINNTKLLECNQYTRPAIWNDIPVPNVLLSGNHKKISEWKRENSLKITRKRRADLLSTKEVTDEEVPSRI